MNAQRVTVKSNGRLVSQLLLPVDVAWVSALLWPNLMHYTRNVKDSKKYSYYKILFWNRLKPTRNSLSCLMANL